MTIYGLALDGWAARSTWGWDEQLGCYYAQLTRDGNSDADGPDVWITPGRRFPRVTSVDILAPMIAVELRTADVQAVYDAMNTGAIAAGGPPAFPIPGSGQPGSTAPGRAKGCDRGAVPAWVRVPEPQVREVHRIAAAWYRDDPTCVQPAATAAALDWVLAGGPSPVSRRLDRPSWTRVLAEVVTADLVVDGSATTPQPMTLTVIAPDGETVVPVPPPVVRHREWAMDAQVACSWITSRILTPPIPLPVRPAPSEDAWFRDLLADADEQTRRDPAAVEHLWRQAEAAARGNARVTAYADKT